MTSMIPTIETSNNELVVSSEQIALGAGVEHRATLQLIETNRAELEEFGGVAFEMRTFATAGGNQQKRVALLNEPQAVLLMTFQRNTAQVKAFKVALIKAFQAMATQLQNPAPTGQNLLALAVLEADKMIKSLEAKVEADAPKVNFWETYCSDDDKISFRTVASVLKVGENDLREGLIFAGWIYSETRSRWSDTQQKKVHRNRYSAMAHKKHLFHAVQNADVPRFGGELMHTLKITLPGAEAISRWVRKVEAEHGSLKQALPILEAKYNEKKAA